jgi:hypothetical protein
LNNRLVRSNHTGNRVEAADCASFVVFIFLGYYQGEVCITFCPVICLISAKRGTNHPDTTYLLFPSTNFFSKLFIWKANGPYNHHLCSDFMATDLQLKHYSCLPCGVTIFPMTSKGGSGSKSPLFPLEKEKASSISSNLTKFTF